MLPPAGNWVFQSQSRWEACFAEAFLGYPSSLGTGWPMRGYVHCSRASQCCQTLGLEIMDERERMKACGFIFRLYSGLLVYWFCCTEYVWQIRIWVGVDSVWMNNLHWPPCCCVVFIVCGTHTNWVETRWSISTLCWSHGCSWNVKPYLEICECKWEGLQWTKSFLCSEQCQGPALTITFGTDKIPKLMLSRVSLFY